MRLRVHSQKAFGFLSTGSQESREEAYKGSRAAKSISTTILKIK